MSRYPLATITLATAATLSAAAPPATAQAPVAAGDDILRTGPRLLSEERRQIEVRRRAITIVRRMHWLLQDLESNGLLEEGNGAQLKETGQLLTDIGTEDVPTVAGQLRQARAELDAALPHIKGAEAGILEVIAGLDQVIEGTGTILVDDRLLKELSEIIKTEELVRRGAADWGKKILLAPDAAKLDRGRLTRAQESVISRYGNFFELLVEAREAAGEGDAGSRFGEAEKALLASKPEAALSIAVDQILGSKALGAVAEQDKAIAALREAEKILAAEEDGFDDLVTAIEQLIAEQKGLKEDTETGENNQFVSQKSQLEARQIGIGNAIVEVAETHLPNYEPQAETADPDGDDTGGEEEIADPFAKPEPGRPPSARRPTKPSSRRSAMPSRWPAKPPGKRRRRSAAASGKRRLSRKPK